MIKVGESNNRIIYVKNHMKCWAPDAPLGQGNMQGMERVMSSNILMTNKLICNAKHALPSI